MNTCQAAGCEKKFAPLYAGTLQEKKWCSERCRTREQNRWSRQTPPLMVLKLPVWDYTATPERGLFPCAS